MKLCLICSAGGHFTEMSQLKEFYKKHDHFFVTFHREDTRELAEKERVYFVADPGRNPIKLVKNIFQSLMMILREKPDMVLSTGAGVAVPACYFAKMLRKGVIFIESFCRIKDPSFSGRLVYPIADLFIIQWKNLAKFYPKAKYGGPVF